MIKLAVAIGGIAATSLAAQNVSNHDLARMLANDVTRQKAVALIAASGKAKLPLLLTWTQTLPPGVEKYELYLGLAEAFGRLKATGAIPFLINNLALEYWPESPNTWTKTPEVIEQRMPAVAALIKIGPEASKALMHARMERMTPEQRLGAIIVVSRIKGVPEARAFLGIISAEANMEHFRAEEGLRYLEEH